VTIDREAVRYSPVNFTSHDGLVTGSHTVMRSADSPAAFSTALNVSRLKLPGLIRELGAEKPVLSGRLSAEFDLTAKRVDGPTVSGLDGAIRVTAADGRLWKFVVVSKVFSVVNILSINQLFEEGLPYKAITGNFKLENGMISSEDLLFESKSMRMSAVGRINAPEGLIKATLGVHPFVTIDKIISTIPLAGWILTGQEKSTVTLYYKVEGRLKDPRVDPLPVKSVGDKVLGIFERLLTAPAKALEPLAPAAPPAGGDVDVKEPPAPAKPETTHE